MSVDIAVSLPRPVTLITVLQVATRTMKSLLGMSVVPAMSIVIGREYRQGIPCSAGRVLDDGELHSLVIGENLPFGPADLVGSRFFEVEMADRQDQAWLQIFDNARLLEFDDEGALSGIEAVVTPTRTAVGVVTSLSVALGVAIASAGRVVEDELQLIPSDFDDFDSFVAEYRLKGGGGKFADRCECFLGQFLQLRGRPSDVSPD